MLAPYVVINGKPSNWDIKELMQKYEIIWFVFREVKQFYEKWTHIKI